MDVATQAAKAAWRYLRTATVYTGPLTLLVEAKRYIDNAPNRVDTPLRRALAGDFWWRSLP